jgi:ABC-type transport system substrate-binding protein
VLLDRFGYKDRDGDGYRETPEGKPLVLEFWSPPTLIARQGDELWKKNMDAIGIRMENQARFRLPEFDGLYDRARTLPDSPERTAIFDRMTELVLAYAPWRLMEHRFEDQLLQPWVGPYFPHPIKGQVWQYVDVDAKARPK